MSGVITLVLKRALEAMVARLTGATAYVVPPAVTAAVILAVLIGVHRLIGTPEIARTIAVPWSVSTLYAIIYTSVLVRGRKGATT
jgi:mannose/fructose/N-acetylgalactosamine-specific phosphotransferase system component IIC